MGSDATATPVDVESVARTAETFQCHELATGQRRSHDALLELRAAAAALALALGAKQGLVDALAASRTEPVVGGRSIALCNGKRSFRTRRGGVFRRLWGLMHPGEALLSDFYEKLGQSHEPSITLDAMYTAAAAALTWERCRAVADGHRATFEELAGTAVTAPS